MARIVLVTGGSRSGKSGHAQRLAEGLPGRKAFVATCPPLDQEMCQRIRMHRIERAGKGWETLEEPVDLAAVLRRERSFEILLVECLTLWVNNLMYEAGPTGREIGEAEVEGLCLDLSAACRERLGTVLLVTNEVGMGIVPDNPLSRTFRDLVGRCNQVMGAAADEVTLMVSGIPVKVK